MKIFFAIIIFILSVQPGNLYSQEPEKFIGTWEGNLNAGVQLRFVLHIKAEPDGSFTSVTDSPDQVVYGIKADRTIINSDTLFFEINSLKASFTGKLENDSTLFGTLKQGMEFPLTLRKKSLSEIPVKPVKIKFQTPVPPFPYNADSVEYDNADKSVHYGATLTYPFTNGNFPCILSTNLIFFHSFYLKSYRQHRLL